MAESATINDVEMGEDYYHVRYRNPDDFDEIRTPDWAENPAGSVAEGAEVRTGDVEGDEDWVVQSVLVPVDAVSDGSGARDAADQIVEKIDS